MKKILFILTALTLITATGCKKEDAKVDYKSNLVGQWHCAPEDMEVDIYVDFEKEGNFSLYQQIGEGRYRKYTGSWTCQGNTLSGTYIDGTPWGSSYKMEFSGSDTMILTALNGSEESMTYVKGTIPNEIKNNSIETKSGGSF